MRLAALTVAVSVALAAPAWAVAADFGDAPGRRPAGYPADLSVLGTFPSLAADKGPQHGRLGPHLGLSATSEGDSRQVDRDRDEGASLKVRRCGSSTLTVIIDARRLPPGAGTVYVNAWFDWNADGDWLDGRARAGCGPEWGVQNVEIDVRRFPGDRYLTVPIRFQAGALPPEFWWRVQVQAETPAAHRGGAAETPYRGGETEDYLQHTRGVGDDDQPPPAVPPPAYRCWGAGEILEHGDGSFHMFEATPTNYALTEPMEVTRLRAEILGETEGVRAVNPQTLGKDSGFVRAFSTAARKHVRNPRVQFLRFVFQFDVRVRERTFPVRVTCPYAISHTSWLAPVQGPASRRRPRSAVRAPRFPGLPHRRAVPGGQRPHPGQRVRELRRRDLLPEGGAVRDVAQLLGDGHRHGAAAAARLLRRQVPMAPERTAAGRRARSHPPGDRCRRSGQRLPAGGARRTPRHVGNRDPLRAAGARADVRRAGAWPLDRLELLVLERPAALRRAIGARLERGC